MPSTTSNSNNDLLAFEEQCKPEAEHPIYKPSFIERLSRLTGQAAFPPSLCDAYRAQADVNAERDGPSGAPLTPGVIGRAAKGLGLDPRAETDFFVIFFASLSEKTITVTGNAGYTQEAQALVARSGIPGTMQVSHHEPSAALEPLADSDHTNIIRTLHVYARVVRSMIDIGAIRDVGLDVFDDLYDTLGQELVGKGLSTTSRLADVKPVVKSAARMATILDAVLVFGMDGDRGAPFANGPLVISQLRQLEPRLECSEATAVYVISLYRHSLMMWEQFCAVEKLLALDGVGPKNIAPSQDGYVLAASEALAARRCAALPVWPRQEAHCLEDCFQEMRGLCTSELRGMPVLVARDIGGDAVLMVHSSFIQRFFLWDERYKLNGHHDDIFRGVLRGAGELSILGRRRRYRTAIPVDSEDPAGAKMDVTF